MGKEYTEMPANTNTQIHIYINVSVCACVCLGSRFSCKHSFLKETDKDFFVLLFLLAFGLLFGFHGISTFVGYLTPNPFLYK